MVHLHHKYPEQEKLNKRHTFIGLSAGTIGTMALMGGGTAAALAMNKKKGSSGGQFDYYDTPQYRELYDKLYGIAGRGIPELGEQTMANFWRSDVPQIQELYRAKRGMGAASMPEISKIAQSAAGLQGQVNLQDRKSVV